MTSTAASIHGPSVPPLWRSPAARVRWLAEEDQGANPGSGDTTAPPPSDPVGDVLAERERVRDQAAADLEADLKKVADGLASKLQAYLRGEAGSNETAAIRAAVYRQELEDWLRFLDANGLADAKSAWFKAYEKLASLAEETLVAAGVPDADRALDGEAAQAALRALRDQHSTGFWESQVARPSAERIMNGLRSSIALQPLEDVAQIIARDEGVALPRARTEAITRVAEFDRWAGVEAATAADPDGDRLFWAYTGPDDGRERPFCDRLNGLFFTRDEIAALDNNQPGTGHPVVSCGGYRCRHLWEVAPEETLRRDGFVRGGATDIQAANAAARGED